MVELATQLAPVSDWIIREAVAYAGRASSPVLFASLSPLQQPGKNILPGSR